MLFSAKNTVAFSKPHLRGAKLNALLLGMLLASCSTAERGMNGPRVMSEDMAAALARAEQTSNSQAAPSRVEEIAPKRPQGFVQPARSDRGIQKSMSDGNNTPPEPGAGISLNFTNADLAGVIDNILGERLGANYMIEEGVQGKVTLQTNRPLNRDQMLAVLREILAMNGAELRDTGGVYKISSAVNSRNIRPIGFSEAAGRGLSVRVTPLAYARADAVGRMLENFAPSDGRIEIDVDRNLIFSIGSAAEQRSIADVISVIDVDFMSDMAFALEPLREANAETVITEVTGILSSGGAVNPAQMIAIERMNAVLIMARSNAAMRIAREWVQRLDQGIGDGQQLFVYPVKNRRAEDLARIVGQVFSIQAIYDAPQTNGLAPGRTGTTLTNQGGLGGGGQGGVQGNGGLGGGQAGQAFGGIASQGFNQGGGQAGFGGNGAAPQNTDVRIIADTATNALIIYADNKNYKPIRKALDRLDVLPVQVLIEATLLEVSLSNELEFGVRWFFDSGDSNFDFIDAAGGGVNPTASGFNYVLDTTDARFVLSALRQVTDVEFLSAPNMMVLDNQVARLQVGDEVPVQTRSAVSTIDPQAPIVNDIEYRSTGVILSVRPKVTNDGLVVLDVTQEVSDVVRTVTSGIISPTIQQRRFESTVAVGSGETVILGGLTSRSTTLGRTGVPILSSIPIIGNAFTSRANTRDRTELLVMITPRVIRNQRAARAATDEMRAKLYKLFEPVPTQAERMLIPMRTFSNRSGDAPTSSALEDVLAPRPVPKPTIPSQE